MTSSTFECTLSGRPPSHNRLTGTCSASMGCHNRRYARFAGSWIKKSGPLLTPSRIIDRMKPDDTNKFAVNDVSGKPFVAGKTQIDCCVRKSLVHSALAPVFDRIRTNMDSPRHRNKRQNNSCVSCVDSTLSRTGWLMRWFGRMPNRSGTAMKMRVVMPALTLKDPTSQALLFELACMSGRDALARAMVKKRNMRFACGNSFHACTVIVQGMRSPVPTHRDYRDNVPMDLSRSSGYSKKHIVSTFRMPLL
jgi:hypothetical protein